MPPQRDTAFVKRFRQRNRGAETFLPACDTNSTTLLKRADGPDLGTQLKELDWDSYNKLDVNQRSRVDVNTLLTQAIDRDQMLLGGLDRNRDGKITAAEAGDEAEGYRSTYESVFGAHRGTARDLEFEEAARLRDEIRRLQDAMLMA